MMSRSTAAVAAAVGALTLAGVAFGASLGGHGRAPYAPMGAPGMRMMAPYAANPATAARQWHHFRGRVTSADRAHHWLRMHTASMGPVRIYTNRHTRWDNCGWGRMRAGDHLDVHAYRSHHHWVATRMQRWHGWGGMMP